VNRRLEICPLPESRETDIAASRGDPARSFHTSIAKRGDTPMPTANHQCSGSNMVTLKMGWRGDVMTIAACKSAETPMAQMNGLFVHRPMANSERRSFRQLRACAN
jgi:hypothetical protein